ncbi:MAG: flagellar export protein FliJ [Pseudomonadales bacterium]|jgi:flagellar FliJ protein|nr:flagellar export protein FliJ [Pseudomonadales bacterium]
MRHPRGTRIDRIAGIAELRTQRLAAGESVHRDARERAEAQLAQLERYREDYSARFQAAGGAWQGRAAEDFRRFLDRLDRAIREQDALVREATLEQERSAESVRASWRTARALGRLSERVETERRRLEDRRDQRALDELGARTARSTARLGD